MKRIAIIPTIAALTLAGCTTQLSPQDRALLMNTHDMAQQAMTAAQAAQFAASDAKATAQKAEADAQAANEKAHLMFQASQNK